MKSVISIAALVLLGDCAKKDGSGALHAGDMLVRVQLDPDPPVAGDNVLRIELMDAQGKGIDGAQIGFIYDMPAMGAMPEMKGGGDVKAKGGGRYEITYPLVHDGSGSVVGDYGVVGFPETFFVDRNGHIVGDHVDGPVSHELLERNIRLALHS